MSRPSRDQFRKLLRTLTTAEFTAFVADIWRARGWDIDVRGDEITATSGRPSAERRVLLVRHTAPRFRRPRWPVGVPEATHVVVSGSRSRRSRFVAEAADATLVDADQLYDLIHYAIDASARERLFRTYFDRPADSFDRPDRTEVPETTPQTPGVSRTTGLAAIVVVLLAAVAVLSVVPGPIGIDVAPRSPSPTVTDSFASTTDGSQTPGSERDPSGSDPAGDVGGGGRVIGPTQGTGEHSWPMFRGGPAHTGRNAIVLANREGPALWATHDIRSAVVSSPTVVNGTVYISSLDGLVYALNSATLESKWRMSVGFSTRSTPAVAEGRVYAAGFGMFEDRVDRWTFALSTSRGTPLWSARTGFVWFSSPTLWNDTVYIGSTSGDVYALSTRGGAIRWRFGTDGAVASTPAVANGTLFVGSNDDRVYAVDASTGTGRWNVTTGDDVISSPAVAGGTVFVGSMDGRVYAFDAATGAERWNVSTGDGVYSSPAVADGSVYVGGTDGRLYAIDAESGEVRWTFETNGSIVSSPAVESDIVYVGSMDDHLYAIRTDSGNLIWRFETGGAIVSSPTPVNGLIYVGSNDGKLYLIWGRASPDFPT